MSFLSDLFGISADDDEAEDEFWELDDREKSDLPMHAHNCGRRWSVTLKLLRSMQAAMRQTRAVLVVIAFVMILQASPPLLDAVGRFIRILTGDH